MTTKTQPTRRRTGAKTPPASPPPESPILNATEAARYLRINSRTLSKAVRDGRIPCAHVGRILRFHREALDAWTRGEAPRARPEISPEQRAAFHAEANAAYARLRGDKKAWAEELAERRETEGTLMDGLENDPYPLDEDQLREAKRARSRAR